jgi:hypothetical protein
MRNHITKKSLLLAATIAASTGGIGTASASLSLFQSVTGVGADATTDGCGSTTASCTLQSNVPTDATIVGAYLYSSTFSSTTNPNGVTLQTGASAAVTPTFTALGVNNSSSILQAWRADVTSYVQANMALGGATLTANEGANSSAIDGEALVVTYTEPSKLTTSTVLILDGFSQSGGDTATVSFSPLATGFKALMQIGDGFSFDGTSPSSPTASNQASTITVNGTLLTGFAGHCDDAQDTSCANGNLITVGGHNAGSKTDPLTPFPGPTIAQDHESYDLSNILQVGDTSATLSTVNPSGDDNIFLEVFELSGTATIVTNCSTSTACPEPTSMALFGVGMLGIGMIRRRRSN